VKAYLEKIVCLLLVLAISAASNASIKDDVDNTLHFYPGKNRAAFFSPPDLEIIECSLISVIRDEKNKQLLIKVSVKVQNNGTVKAGNSAIVAYYKTPAGSGEKKEIAATLPVGIIKPKQYFGTVYVFPAPLDDFKKGAFFDFWVKADGKDEILESVETNNESKILKINTPIK
jgi:hypothetical protein